MATTRTTCWMVGLLAAGLVAGCSGPATGGTNAGGAGSTTSTSATAPTSTGTGTTRPGTSDTGGATNIALTGSASGKITQAAVECNVIDPPGEDRAFSWRLTGTVNGQAVNLTFNTNYYRGAATYNGTGITDEQGGLLTLTVGDPAAPEVQAVTDGSTRGTFTVAAGGMSGSVDAELNGVGQKVQVEGNWRCS